MRRLFADTGYWIALLSSHDYLHDKAIELSKDIQPAHIITSDMVLAEVLNDFSRRTETLRLAAVALVEELRKDPNTTVVAQTRQQFDRGLELYKRRPDKNWSQTDCVSFLIMKEQGISEALAYDRHFAQAGYIAVMRDEE